MITLYELKNQGFCRCFIRTPFYIKNMFLLIILSFVMTMIYFIYFRRDGMTFSNITKILKGLNSNTFNYLEVNSEPLRLTRLLNNYQAQITTNQFFDDCVRINKPCKFEGLAKTWSGYEKWKFGDKGYDYLKSKLSNQQVEVYVDMEADDDPSVAVSAGNSFKNTTKSKMRYSEFLTKMTDNKVHVTLKDGNQYISKALLDEIAQPPFIAEINEIEEVEMMQGQTFVNPPHYERREQFLCSIDGYLQTKLIPHIYRQEVYAGKDKIIIDKDASENEKKSSIQKTDVNQSPLDFFEPNLENYPNFKEIERKYTVLLHEGDCVYIPSFYFYQFVAKPQNGQIQEGVKSSSLAVALKYKGNSAMLNAFFDAVEKNILT